MKINIREKYHENGKSAKRNHRVNNPHGVLNYSPFETKFYKIICINIISEINNIYIKLRIRVFGDNNGLKRSVHWRIGVAIK